MIYPFLPLAELKFNTCLQKLIHHSQSQYPSFLHIFNQVIERSLQREILCIFFIFVLLQTIYISFCRENKSGKSIYITLNISYILIIIKQYNALKKFNFTKFNKVFKIIKIKTVNQQRYLLFFIY